MASGPKAIDEDSPLALSTAIKHGSESEAKNLIAAKADANQRSQHDFTTLILAVINADKFENCGETLVACLLDAGADPLLHTATKNTALHFAFALNRDVITNQLMSGR